MCSGCLFAIYELTSSSLRFRGVEWSRFETQRIDLRRCLWKFGPGYRTAVVSVVYVGSVSRRPLFFLVRSPVLYVRLPAYVSSKSSGARISIDWISIERPNSTTRPRDHGHHRMDWTVGETSRGRKLVPSPASPGRTLTLDLCRESAENSSRISSDSNRSSSSLIKYHHRRIASTCDDPHRQYKQLRAKHKHGTS